MSFTPANISAMVSEIAAVFESMLPQIGLIAGISDAKLTNITTAIDDLRQAARAFASTDAPGETLARIEHDAEAVLTVLATLPLPPQVALGFRIAQCLLPVLVAMGRLIVSHNAAAA